MCKPTWFHTRKWPATPEENSSRNQWCCNSMVNKDAAIVRMQENLDPQATCIKMHTHNTQRNPWGCQGYLADSTACEFHCFQWFVVSILKLFISQEKAIKEASAHCFHQPFGLSTGFVIDVMHCVCLGVLAKTLMNLWLNQSHHASPFIITRKVIATNSLVCCTNKMLTLLLFCSWSSLMTGCRISVPSMISTGHQEDGVMSSWRS